MPDEWESAHGLDPNEPDNNRQFGEGYTVLEVYLHYAMTGAMMDGEVWAEGIEDPRANSQEPTAHKILREGQIYIQCGGRLYSITGLEIND